MTAPSLGRLLISHITLRGPELEQLYGHIVAHAGVSYEELGVALIPSWICRSQFGLDEAAMREALNFLLVAGLLAQQGDSRRKATFQAVPLPPTLSGASFRLILLHFIWSHSDERQRAIVSVQRQLVQHDTLAITAQDMRVLLERGPLSSLFAWTGEKVNFWTHLASYLGLIRRLERSSELLIVPQLGLVLDALRWASTQNELALTNTQRPSASLYFCLKQIDETLFSCFTSSGRVHQGLGQTLVMMHRLGYLTLTHSADAAKSVLLGDWRVSNVKLSETGGAIGLQPILTSVEAGS